jgi:peroxiredoxin
MNIKILYLLFFFIPLSAVSQQKVALNTVAPEFKLWLTDGSKLTNQDIKGKVVVFKFWFTSCMPCLTGIPKLNSLVKEFKNREDILFIAPALDRKPIIEKLLKVHPFNFKIAYSAMDVSQTFNKKQVYPSYFIINKKGEISYIDSGSKKSEFKKLRKAILKALKM